MTAMCCAACLPHAVSRLVGAPPGYVGYGDGGLLTDAVRWAARAAMLCHALILRTPNLRILILHMRARRRTRAMHMQEMSGGGSGVCAAS